MLRFVSFIALCLIINLSSVCYAKEPSGIEQPKTAQDLYNLLVGNTLVATTSFGNNSNEYHAPDGRILGYNWDTEQNENSCWRVVDKNVVCYYYANMGGDTCWNYRRVKEDRIEGYVTTSPKSTIDAIIKKGNPENLSDFGIKWICKAQIVASLPNSHIFKGPIKSQQ